MPNSTNATMKSLGILHAFGYDLRITYHEYEGGAKRFKVVALGLSQADAPLGEVGLSSCGTLYPALNAAAKHLGFGLSMTGGGVLMRFLVEISAALDNGEGLDGEWDFTHDPASPLARELETAGVSA
ncbi:hypothetical protein [Glycomyces buryatensis]|uniref:Uncharacterized protein n=1 Tax=Glycomyces buryatensis TaxID=2570927 RepID=A0A4S8Q8D9_9ACTN|nr:hypothetical protein [Glycomyces buryatensis]THV39651.1 hypothetical protein FAB82_17430 [Glycomyces buryatensis]